MVVGETSTNMIGTRGDGSTLGVGSSEQVEEDVVSKSNDRGVKR